VESSEFKVIQEHLQAIQFAAQETADAKRRLESAELVRQTVIRQREDETTRLAAAQSSVQDLEQRISALRHEVERRVKAPGADLKAAPFRAAANVKTLAAYTEVVIVIVTPHWYGVETPTASAVGCPRSIGNSSVKRPGRHFLTSMIRMGGLGGVLSIVLTTAVFPQAVPYARSFQSPRKKSRVR